MTAAPLPRQPCWRALLESQDQVLARIQALGSGLSEEAWQWRLDKELWRSVLPGVAIAHSGEPTDRQRAWAAYLHAGLGAALSGDIALVEQGFRLKDLRTVDVAVPVGRRVAGADLLGGPRLFAHRVSHLDRWVHPARELAVVRVPAATLHAAAWAVSDRAAEWRIAAVVQQRLVTPADLRTTLAQMPRLRRRQLISVVLDDVELGAHAASELEFLRFCRRNGLPVPDELQVLVRSGGKRYLDGRYTRQKVSLEIDGAHHRWVEQWDADALRGLELAAHRVGTGEQQIRLTTGNLRHDEQAVASFLRTLLT